MLSYCLKTFVVIKVWVGLMFYILVCEGALFYNTIFIFLSVSVCMAIAFEGLVAHFA
ncbi:hypothetical protein TUM4261_03800 [Shewanella sp. c952]|nr:hypothetical protein TUM4261_03800 [Shewanella sp. c952]